MASDDEPDVEDLRAAIASARSSINRAVMQAIAWLRSRNTDADIADRIGAGSVADVVSDVDRAGEMIAQAVNDAYEQSMRDVAQVISGAIDSKFHADPQNPLAVQAMRDNRLRVVREIVDEQRDVIRAIMTETVQAGENPLVAARQIRESIGLTQRQLDAVANYRRALERNSVDALTRELRDRRFDGTVRGAAAGDRAPMTQAQIDRMVERYRERWIRYRAETIARTEGIRAVHEGADQAYEQAIARGDLSADLLECQWHHHDPQKNPRPQHQEMNGQKRPWGMPFESGSGALLLYPCDPDAPASETVCCHCGRTVRIKSIRDRAAA